MCAGAIWSRAAIPVSDSLSTARMRLNAAANDAASTNCVKYDCKPHPQLKRAQS